MSDEPRMDNKEAPDGETPELTPRAIILGLILSVVMGAANVYLGLKAGMTVSASIPAAVVAMLILRGVLGGGTLLEANQVQTTASAGESLAAGIIFTMPALILIGAWDSFDLLTTTVIALAGGLLGILFMIPMRRVFVVDNDELKYPEGLACASVLKAGDAEDDGSGDHAKGARAVVIGGVVGAVFKLGVSFLGVIRGTLEGALATGQAAVEKAGAAAPEVVEGARRIFYFGGDVSPALVGVGFIVRLNVAVLIFVGGGLGWLIGIPLLDGRPYEDALDGAWTLWSTQIRYVGVGAMVVGGVSSIWKVRGGLVRAVKELVGRFQGGVDDGDDQRDLSPRVIAGLSLAAIALVFGTYFSLTDDLAITSVTTVIMIVMSFFFTAVASYIVGLVGNSNSPVSGMTITAVLFTAVMLFMFGFRGESGMLATLGVAAIVCCAACTSGDVCNDLKTGALVGARPYRQQIMQVAGVAIASLVMAPILQLLHDNTPGGIGGRELAAPQAGLFASLVQGFFGDGQLPWNMVGIGAGLGVLILIIDAVLAAQKSSFRAHLMPIAVGIYLPFGLSVPILIGGVIAHLVLREHKAQLKPATPQGATAGDQPAAVPATEQTGGEEVDEDRVLQSGVLLASGIIAGESLTGVGIAILAALGINRLDLGLPGMVTFVVTVIAAAAVPVFMWRVSRSR
jgi:putative OPT family oligopeptide transporter